MLGIMMLMSILSIDHNAQNQVIGVSYRLIESSSIDLAECERMAYTANSKYPLQVGSLTVVCAPDINVPFHRATVNAKK